MSQFPLLSIFHSANALLISLFLVAPLLASTPTKFEPIGLDETNQWRVTGTGVVHASAATIDRLTQGVGITGLDQTDELTILWNDARLESTERNATEPLPISLKMTIQIGHTMTIGGEYGGFLTLVSNASGELGQANSRRKASFSMDNRGMYVAQFLHSDSRGPDHLYFEIPFSLHDKETGAIIAQNRMYAGVNLSNRDQPVVEQLTIRPLADQNLTRATQDIGRVLSEGWRALSSPVHSEERFESQINLTNMSSVTEAGQVKEFFSESGKVAYGCGSGQLMSIEFESPGFARGDSLVTSPYRLVLFYAPPFHFDLGEQKYAHLEPVSGELIIQRPSGEQVIEIAPGNHGNVYSHVTMSGDELVFVFGVTLKEVARDPAIAKLSILCNAGPVGTSCSGLTLSTAVDVGGRVVTKRALSDVFDDPSPLRSSGAISKKIIRGGSSGCPSLCNTCDVEGCLPGSGDCDTAGAPLGCNTVCQHQNSLVQCCKATGRACCRLKCGFQK